MAKIKIIILELFTNLQLIWAVSRYNNKSDYEGTKFGKIWEILDPIIQVGIYFFMFGSIRGRSDVYFGFEEVEMVAFFPWMLAGMVAWMFMKKTTSSGSKSVVKKLSLVSKMKFPMSILPAMTIASVLPSLLVTIVVAMVILPMYGIFPNLYWLQLIYYVFAVIVFMYFFALLNSTIMILFKDYAQVLGPFMRFNMFFAGVIWRRETVFPTWFVRLMDLNPLTYIVDGFRYSFFREALFWQHWETTLFFWLMMLLLAIAASHFHLKLRNKFIDLD